METRNFKAKVLIQKMSITKYSQIENGDSTTLNHCLAIFQLQKFRTCHLSTSKVLKVVKHMVLSSFFNFFFINNKINNNNN